MKKLITFVITVPVVCVVALRVAAILSGDVSIAAFAAAAGPLVVIGVVGGALALTAFVLNLVTGDHSWVDRMWSTVPVVYGWIYAQASGYDQRTTIAAVLVAVWGARLTFNFARRGGFTTFEDHRWPVLRQKIANPFLWQLFSFLFISGFQNLMFVLFTLPLYALYLARGGFAGYGFWAGAVAFLLFLIYETVADQQQWSLQNAKARAVSGDADPLFADDMRRGFRTTGLFRFSRHPNYYGELMIWWMVYLMGATAVGTAVHWSGAGALLLTLLFVGSTVFTESITAGKYPDYAAYRVSTSAIIPLPPRNGSVSRAPNAYRD